MRNREKGQKKKGDTEGNKAIVQTKNYPFKSYSLFYIYRIIPCKTQGNQSVNRNLFKIVSNWSSEMPTGELRYPSPLNSSAMETSPEKEEVWAQIKTEARRDVESEPALASYLYSTILSHPSLERSLAFHLGNKLCSSTLLSTLLYDLFLNTISSDSTLLAATVANLRVARAP